MEKSKPKRPSSKVMEEVFYEIVEFAAEQGCPIKVHTKLDKVNGSNGYFTSDPNPHIEVALRGKSWPRAIQLVIHEFCHYWQWKDGFLGKKDDEGNILYSKLLDGEVLTPKEREKARVLIQISEYDCEIRTASLFDKWRLQQTFPLSSHIRSSSVYNRHIAWSVGDKNCSGSGVFYHKYDTLADQLWGNRKFEHFWNPKTFEGQQLILAPISDKHRSIFDKVAKIKRDERGNPI